MIINCCTFVNIQDVNSEKHLSVGLVTKQTIVYHIKECHRVWSAWYTYEIQVIFPDSKVLSQTRLKFVNQDFKETIFAYFILFIRVTRRVYFALEAFNHNFLRWCLFFFLFINFAAACQFWTGERLWFTASLFLISSNWWSLPWTRIKFRNY